jgi:hypothetical protein
MNIDKNILAIIENGRTENNLFYLPSGQLDRQTYLKVNSVLENLGGKWNKKIKAHLFESDMSDAIDDVLLTGSVINKKQEFQFFETPIEIVYQLIELANILPHHMCLEPSAGKGAIAEEIRKIVGNDNLRCIEYMPENVYELEKKEFRVSNCNFLAWDAVSCLQYDRIVMNPPFTRQQDIQHVEKALSFLKDDGILISVMSPGITFRQDKKTKEFIDKLKNYRNYEIIELPHGAFKISGTMVNTIILKVNK